MAERRKKGERWRKQARGIRRFTGRREVAEQTEKRQAEEQRIGPGEIKKTIAKSRKGSGWRNKGKGT